MNKTIEQLLNRRSVRNFTGESVNEQDLMTILQAAQQAPTSINGQQISLVVTRDKAKIAAIADIAGGQPQVASADVFVTVVIDYYRTGSAMKQVDAEQVIPQSAEGIVVGTVDAGIMLNAVQVAAEALGYGTTAIGSIRNNPQLMIELLDLPKNTYPVVGTTIGVVDPARQSGVKSRVDLGSFAMFEKYDADKVAQGAADYDKKLRQWWDSQGMSEMPSYAASTAHFYSQVYFPTVAETMQRQGFSFKDK